MSEEKCINFLPEAMLIAQSTKRNPMILSFKGGRGETAEFALI